MSEIDNEELLTVLAPAINPTVTISTHTKIHHKLPAVREVQTTQI